MVSTGMAGGRMGDEGAKGGRAKDGAASAGQPGTIRDLLSYQVSRTANAMSRSAALRFAAYGVTLQEWRTLALLAASAPLGLNELARAAGLDKAQMSRAVSALIARELVQKRPSEAGRRATSLTLSRRGRALYADLIAAAAERDRAFRACLNPEEQAVLSSALHKLQSVALALARASEGAAAHLPRSVDNINHPAKEPA